MSFFCIKVKRLTQINYNIPPTLKNNELEKERTKNIRKYEKWFEENKKKGNIVEKQRIDGSEKADYGDLFLVTNEEMYGKYGWFSSSYRYNLPTYYTGYLFTSKKILNNYLDYQQKIKKVETDRTSEEFMYMYEDVKEYAYFPEKNDIEENNNFSLKDKCITYYF